MHWNRDDALALVLIICGATLAFARTNTSGAVAITPAEMKWTGARASRDLLPPHLPGDIDRQP
jgi:hypothetical protein